LWPRENDLSFRVEIGLHLEPGVEEALTIAGIDVIVMSAESAAI